MIRNLAIVLTLSTAAVATAAPFDLNTATGLFTPSFRGAANTTWTGWDTWNENLDGVITDSTPDVGTHGGSFNTTNNEDHRSGSANYYAAGGSVAEAITFTTPTGGPGGYTTVIVQGLTLFGAWSNDVTFSPIDGVSPTLEVMELTNNNAAGAGQFFVKYEIPGVITNPAFSISAAPGHTSMGLFVVDASWSAAGFAADTAVHTPEPTSAVIALVGIASAMLRRRS
jgi:hypothetical protein